MGAQESTHLLLKIDRPIPGKRLLRAADAVLTGGEGEGYIRIFWHGKWITSYTHNIHSNPPPGPCPHCEAARPHKAQARLPVIAAPPWPGRLGGQARTLPGPIPKPCRNND